MPKPSSKAILMLLASLLAYTSTACERDAAKSSQQPPPNPASGIKTPATATTGEAQSAHSPTSAPALDAKNDPFQLGLERAKNAYRISKIAQSSDDWRLVAARWQQAINLMKLVSAASPYRAQAQQKLIIYQQSLAQAQQQANRSTKPLNPNGVIVLSPASLPTLRPSLPLAAAPRSAPVVQPPAPAANDSPNGNRAFYAPIVRREGNTPVIRVTFNKAQPFDMIVDTGASGTLITQQMAKALNVKPVAKTSVDTASQRDVSFPLGYINSIEVGGAVATNVLVAVAGPDLEVGLLGHDFFGHYDVTIRETEVEFQERAGH